MATLSRSQMVMYATAAGLPNPRLWAEIGMAESGGRTDVVNSIGATGWLQINQPVHVKAHPTWTKAWLKNPLNNALAAKVLYKEAGLKPWASSRSKWGASATSAGISRADWKDWFVPEAPDDWTDPGDLWDSAPLIPLLPGLQQGDVPFSPNPFELKDAAGATVNALADFGNWIADPHNWLRILYGVGGAVLVVAGLYVMAQPVLNQAVNSVPSPIKGMAKSAGGAVKSQTSKAGSALKGKVSSGGGGS